MLREFPNCLEYMLDYGLSHCISTNATVFSESILRHLHRPRMCVVTSIDAGTAETYARTKGQDLLASAWENVVQYASVGGKRVTIKYIVTDHNFQTQELDAFVDEIQRRDLTKNATICADVSHHKSHVDNHIIEALSYLDRSLRSIGAEPSIGLHGAHTLPRERVIERVALFNRMAQLESRLVQLEKQRSLT